MGLDATVYCDCFERGKLRRLPKEEWAVYVDEGGLRSSRAKDHQLLLAFDQWNMDACEHEWGVLLHHRIGNIAAVSLLREVLSGRGDIFAITLSRILYSGTHCGDFIGADQVGPLEPEVRALGELHSKDAMEEEWIRHFEGQLRELMKAGLRVGKGICF